MQRKIVPDVIKDYRCMTTEPGQSAKDAATLMNSHKIGALVVTEGDQLVGIVTERDMLCKVIAQGENPDDLKVSDIMTADPDTVGPDTLASSALEMMVTRKYRHLPIVDDAGKAIGMVSVRDLYEAVQLSLQEDLRTCEAYVHGEGYGVGA